MDYYIASRLGHNQMAEVLETKLYRLNERMSQRIRSAAKKKGIAGVRNGKKYNLYCVSKEQMEQISDESFQTLAAIKHGFDPNPLFHIEDKKIDQVIDQVNPKYPKHFNRVRDAELLRKYKTELIDNLSEHIVPMNAEKPKSKRR